MRRLLVVMLAAGTVAGAMLLSTARPEAQGQGQAVGRPEWVTDSHHDVIQSLRDLPDKPLVSTRPEFEVLRPSANERGGQDTVVQNVATAPFAGQFGLFFPGLGANGYAPPDTVGEAGPTQYVQWVNVQFAVFDKTSGALLFGPKAGNYIWSGFGGDCEKRNDGDPIVQYDQLNQVWIMTQFAVASRNYMQCVAVSDGPDFITSTWHRYSFPYSDFPDYPKLTVWPDAYYITFNMFRNGRSFSGGRACAYDKAAMIAGVTATQVCFQVSNASLLPSDVDGPAPPAGAPNYVLSRGSNALNLWKFHVDFATPGNSTFTGPISVSGVAPFTIACNGGACIPQKGTSTKLDSLGDRLMYRLAYRNFGDHEALVVNHSVTAGSATAIRWYEIRGLTTTPAVFQQGTYQPNGLYRWMGSIASDKLGNIAVGYSTSSSSAYPSIEWASRGPNDAAGTLSAPFAAFSGTGSQTGSLQRWGDYSTISIDPTDDCTFWYTTEYIPSNGSFNWQTYFASFKLPGCGPSPSPAQAPEAGPARPAAR